MKKLTVIAPAYNEAQVLPLFYNRLKPVLDGLSNFESKVIFVLDRCTDSTFEVASQIAQQDVRVQVIQLSNRFGHQMALLAGIDHAEGDYIISIDSDLQHPPELIVQMIEKAEAGYDIVSTIRDDSEGFGFLKRNSSKVFYKVLNSLSNIPIQSGGSDFRLITKQVADVFRNDIRERNQFIRGLISWVGFDTIGIEFKSEKRAAGRSKYSVKRLFRFATQGLVSFSKKPLQAAAFIGTIIALLGFVLAFLTIFDRYFGHQKYPPGWATIVSLVSIFSGVQLVFLGVLGEYLGAIFDEVKARPHYIVKTSVGFFSEKIGDSKRC